MKFTLSWLKDHLETNASLQDITDKLTAIGLEVEDVKNPAEALEPFIVAQVISAEKHPDADRLKLCKVSTGSEEIQVVCGAPNARAGLKGILARPGDVIPSTEDALKVGKIRGVESNGMLCSAQELNLGDDHDGIIELSPDSQVGSRAAEALSLEPVIDIALTPNRVDALGVRGVARDLAAAGLGKLKALDVSPVAGTFDSPRNVAMSLPVDQEHLCPHFVGRTIRGVKNTESPAWLKDRLTAIGLRPVSAIVDVTQYITVDLGRPLHAFDTEKVSGHIGPRLARNDEQISALNGSEYKLSKSMVVIADERNALAIAGVMGGEPSGCTESTTEIFLESALFDPVNIATTGRSLGIVSDARYCFERGVDPASTNMGAEIATKVIMEICGGEASHLVNGGAEPMHNRVVSFRPARVAKLGGIDLTHHEIKDLLTRLGFVVSIGSKDEWSIDIPSWRGDVDGEHDLIEEVLRVKGYDAIPVASLPRPAVSKSAFSQDQRRVRSIRRAMAARGLHETTTWSFLSGQHAELFANGARTISLENPISVELDVMRPSLLPNLVLAAGRNADHAIPNAALFEIGPSFQGALPGEQMLVVAGLRFGDVVSRHWSGSTRSADAFDAKADALSALDVAGIPTNRVQTRAAPESPAPPWYHPGQSGALRLGSSILAEFGVLHPLTLKKLGVDGPIVGFEVFLDRLPKRKNKAGAARPKFSPSAFQPVERDFAFVVDNTVQVDDIIRAVRGSEKELISDVVVFDVYSGDKLESGKTSVALSVRLEPVLATLTDLQIEDVSQKIIAAVEKSVGGQLRG